MGINKITDTRHEKHPKSSISYYLLYNITSLILFQNTIELNADRSHNNHRVKPFWHSLIFIRPYYINGV